MHIFFINWIGPSQNEILNIQKYYNKKTKKTYNPKEKIIKKYQDNTQEALLKYNIPKQLDGAYFISFFPFVGSNIQDGEKTIKRNYDCDNYAGITKIIQDVLTDKDSGIIKKDSQEYIKCLYINQTIRDVEVKKTGMIVILQEYNNNSQYIDLKKQLKEVDKLILQLKKEA